MTTQTPAKPRTAGKAPSRLRRRHEFVRAAKSGVHHSARAFKLQAAARPENDSGAARFGFTVTKKVAGAVGRNRIRRRLKEALRISGGLAARPGHDYVFVARRAALTASFPELLSQMADGLARLQRRVEAPGRHNPRHNPKDRPPAP